MTKDHYTFVGCTCALEYYVNASSVADKQTALDACAELVNVRESIMKTCENDSSNETAQKAFGQHVVSVLESIELIRSTSLYTQLDSTLTDLLDYFYNTADNIMGGGGCTHGAENPDGTCVLGSSYWYPGSGSGW